MVRALASHARGQGFESLHVHHNTIRTPRIARCGPSEHQKRAIPGVRSLSISATSRLSRALDLPSIRTMTPFPAGGERPTRRYRWKFRSCSGVRDRIGTASADSRAHSLFWPAGHRPAVRRARFCADSWVQPGKPAAEHVEPRLHQYDLGELALDSTSLNWFTGRHLWTWRRLWMFVR